MQGLYRFVDNVIIILHALHTSRIEAENLIFALRN